MINAITNIKKVKKVNQRRNDIDVYKKYGTIASRRSQ
jgi:hypothetical protein